MMRRGGTVRRLGCCERVAGAVGFALFALPLCFGLLMMVDLGLSTGTRMELDRNVRAGAQAAMSLNNDAAAIREVVRAASGDASGLDVAVDMDCACGAAASGCSALCAGGAAPSVFFAIRAARPYSGMLLGERTIASGARVQIR
ncbi:hypothetical protein BH23PSE1_BH23PSE1_13240 [soil metagenome]